ADRKEIAPTATMTAAVWNWAVHDKPTVEAACGGKWTQGGKVTIPAEYKNWMGSFKDGAVGVAPLNEAALASHPRKDQVQKLYNDEVAAFKSGSKNMASIFNGPIKDNTGQVRI